MVASWYVFFLCNLLTSTDWVTHLVVVGHHPSIVFWHVFHFFFAPRQADSFLTSWISHTTKLINKLIGVRLVLYKILLQMSLLQWYFDAKFDREAKGSKWGQKPSNSSISQFSRVQHSWCDFLIDAQPNRTLETRSHQSRFTLQNFMQH